MVVQKESTETRCWFARTCYLLFWKSLLSEEEKSGLWSARLVKLSKNDAEFWNGNCSYNTCNTIFIKYGRYHYNQIENILCCPNYLFCRHGVLFILHIHGNGADLSNILRRKMILYILRILEVVKRSRNMKSTIPSTFQWTK